jgi:integrase/recombinase XerD
MLSGDGTMARVNIIKQIKISRRWVFKAIPRKENGERDWNALPEGRYFIEWRESGTRVRLPAGRTVSQALEARRIKKAELAATEVGILQRYKPVESPSPPTPVLLSGLIRRYLDQIDTLKKRNTYRKYNAVLTRFEKHFTGWRLEQISTEELNDFIVNLKKSGLSANTVLHTVIIIAQFFRRNGRRDITRELQLPEPIHALPRMYSEEEQSRFLSACDPWEFALFSTFLLTGFREQEVMHLFWRDLNLKLRTVRVVSKPEIHFFPKRWEEREVPIPADLAQLLANHPQFLNSPFVFPSPTGNREQNFLRRCKEVASRAGLDASMFDLKTFRSTYATSMLRSGFDIRTVQHWMGHKSVETTMRYLVPAQDVHDRLDLIGIPGRTKNSSIIKARKLGGDFGSNRKASCAS